MIYPQSFHYFIVTLSSNPTHTRTALFANCFWKLWLQPFLKCLRHKILSSIFLIALQKSLEITITSLVEFLELFFVKIFNFIGYANNSVWHYIAWLFKKLHLFQSSQTIFNINEEAWWLITAYAHKSAVSVIFYCYMLEKGNLIDTYYAVWSHTLLFAYWIKSNISKRNRVTKILPKKVTFQIQVIFAMQ